MPTFIIIAARFEDGEIAAGHLCRQVPRAPQWPGLTEGEVMDRAGIARLVETDEVCVGVVLGPGEYGPGCRVSYCERRGTLFSHDAAGTENDELQRLPALR